jgi:8-oxo-dGTP pyrophosphatase MutT (NUDIX family)
MPNTRIAFVDVLVLRGAGESLQVLCLRRASSGRSAGSWEAVHGHVDPGETPVATAQRELQEEAGLRPVVLFNLSRVESFYRHASDEVVLVPVFAAFVPPESVVRLSTEHDAFEWLPPGAARERMSWPRIRREITDAVRLVGRGEAGVLEDVLRVEG